MAINKLPRLRQRTSAESQADLPLDRGPTTMTALFFLDPDRPCVVDDATWSDVSAPAVTGRPIIRACDEAATIERVSFEPKSGDDGFDNVEDIDRDAVRGSDHAEGIAAIAIDGVAKSPVAHQSPHAGRTGPQTPHWTTDIRQIGSAKAAAASRAATGKGRAAR
ncbi:MAG TPA: hypothetical protein VIN77_07595 [Aurantimonas sp.]